MAKRDEFRHLLKEMGVSEYELRKFRESQKEFREAQKINEKFNAEIMGNSSTTSAYNYQSFYNYVKYTGTTPKQAIKDLYKEQKQQLSIYEQYGVTKEVYDLVVEAWNVLEQHTDLTAESLNPSRFDRFFDDISNKKIDRLHELLDEIYRYQEMVEMGIVKDPYSIEEAIYERVAELAAMF